MRASESTGDEQRDAEKQRYKRTMLEIRGAFDAGATGEATIAARTQAMDDLVCTLWQRGIEQDPKLKRGVALLSLTASA